MFRTVHVNHLGFRPDDPMKRALLPLPPGGGGRFLDTQAFQVIRADDLIRHAACSPAYLAALNNRNGAVEDTPLGRFAVCEFGDMTARGGYQIQCGDALSYPFLIYRDLWKRCFRLLLEWYRIAACGEAVPGYHEVCHLDDCVLAETGEQADLVGGWHDAGDLRKWTSTMSYVTLALADFADEWGGDPGAVGVDPDLLWRQIRRGAEYLAKPIDPRTGMVWHSIASDVNTGNESGVWTDNIPRSGDERGAKQDCSPDTADSHVQTLAALARVLRARHPDLAADARAAAERVYEAMRRPLAEKNGPEALIDADIRMWEATGEERYAAGAAAGLRALAARQVVAAAFNQDRIRGFFLKDGAVEGNGDFRRRGGRSLFRHADHAWRFAQALRLWPGHADAGRWRDALTALVEGCLEPMILLNPYRALPACLCLDTEPAPSPRPLAGRLRFRYFGVEAEGNNAQLADAAAALTLAARVLNRPRWATLAQKQLEWIFGFNPFETCMMTGLGYSSAAVFSFYVGQIPGAIINGITGRAEDDAPVLCMDREASPMNMEYWSVHTAAVLRALALLERTPLG